MCRCGHQLRRNQCWRHPNMQIYKSCLARPLLCPLFIIHTAACSCTVTTLPALPPCAVHSRAPPQLHSDVLVANCPCLSDSLRSSRRPVFLPATQHREVERSPHFKKRYLSSPLIFHMCRTCCTSKEVMTQDSKQPFTTKETPYCNKVKRLKSL